MDGVGSQFAWSVAAVCLCLSLVCPALAGQTHKERKAAKTQAASGPAAPSQPLAPLTLQQMPATPPQVSYNSGELTIVAQNSTLGDILRAVKNQTGAALDVPANTTERVVGQIGPGSPQEVLAQLLNGSHFNYVILGSATDSGKVQRVILTPKPSPPPDNVAQAPVSVAPAAPQTEGQFGFNQQQANDDDDDTSDAPADQSDGSQPPTQAPVRTPEQLLQELQRQQKMQQQQQEQQGSAPATPVPPQRN